MTTQVGFQFDPACPQAWMASRWILEAEKVRDVRVIFHTISLYILDEGYDLNPGYRERISATLVTSRAAATVQKFHDHDVLRDFYTALGTRLHPGDEPVAVKTVATALTDCGLEASIAKHITTDKFDTDLRAYQKVTQNLVGIDVGTPITRVNDTTLFDPVISPAPEGKAAGELSDDFVRVIAYPGFFELRRSRGVGPIFD